MVRLILNNRNYLTFTKKDMRYKHDKKIKGIFNEK